MKITKKIKMAGLRSQFTFGAAGEFSLLKSYGILVYVSQSGPS